MPPSRIENIQAFDHANDDGTAIDVVWSISSADDFSHYIVWAADKPVDDISYLWNACLRLTIRGTTGALRQMRTDLEGVLIDGYTMKLGSESEFNPEFADFLPERQTLVLNKAINMGYYDRPRQCTQREIADELNLKQATVSEHLQAAESAIIHRYSSDL